MVLTSESSSEQQMQMAMSGVIQMQPMLPMPAMGTQSLVPGMISAGCEFLVAFLRKSDFYSNSSQ